MSDKQFRELKRILNKAIHGMNSATWLIFWGLVINGCMSR